MAKRDEIDFEKLGEKQVNRDVKAMILANPDMAPQDLPLPGPLQNPGFEVVPWKARPEMTNRGVGRWTPSHLHIYSTDEKDPKHYPKAAQDKQGNFTHFCWACGRPTTKNGLSGKKHAGSGKACPACGFKRKTQKIDTLENVKRREVIKTKALAETNGARLSSYERQKKRKSVNELMIAKAEERAESLLKPYFDGLELAPKDEWSPSTKLEFYMNQTQIAEKLLNRVEGMPVSRTRHVDKLDEDVLRDDELSPHVLSQLVAAIVTGGDVKELLEGDVVDAEFSEVESPPE